MKSLQSFSAIFLVVFVLQVFAVGSKYADPDYNKTVPQIIESRGFKSQTHYITTQDGYILTTFRILNPIAAQSKEPLKPVVLSHGLIGTGNDFLVTSPGGDLSQTIFDNRNDLGNIDFNATGNNLGFILANLGYDIWLPQTRGTYYSINHTKYNPKKDKKFWEFSFDEIALFDTPAIINHIRSVTHHDEIGWIGHSQGAGTVFALLAERPEYSNFVKPFISLAPAVRLDHATGGIHGLVANPISQAILMAKHSQCFGPTKYTRLFAHYCDLSDMNRICRWLVTKLVDFNLPSMDETRVPVYIWNDPSGTSCWNAAHFGQIISSKQFQKMDYGSKGNLEKYGWLKPPLYPLDKINSTHMAIFHGPDDHTVSVEDIETVESLLQVDLLLDYLIPEPTWDHLDHIFSKKTGLLQNSVIAILLDSYRPSHQRFNENLLRK